MVLKAEKYTAVDSSLYSLMLVMWQRKFWQATVYGCILDSVQPLAVCNHQLLFVQPNYSGKRNTAKSCIEYSQNICSVKFPSPYKDLLESGKKLNLEYPWNVHKKSSRMMQGSVSFLFLKFFIIAFKQYKMCFQIPLENLSK